MPHLRQLNSYAPIFVPGRQEPWPDDFDYVTELGVELAAYAAILLKSPAEQISWLQRVNDLAAATLRRLEEDHA